MRFSAKRRPAFTLLELMITTVIMGILVAIIFGNYSRERPRADLKAAIQRLQDDLKSMQSKAQGGVLTSGVKRFGYGVYFNKSYTVPSPPNPANTFGYPTYADGLNPGIPQSEGYHENTEPPDFDIFKRPFPKDIRILHIYDAGATEYTRADAVYTVPNGRMTINAFPGPVQLTTLRIILKHYRINQCYMVTIVAPIGTVSTRQLTTSCT